MVMRMIIYQQIQKYRQDKIMMKQLFYFHNYL